MKYKKYLMLAASALLITPVLRVSAAVIAPVSALSATGNLSSRPIEEAINGNGLSSGGTSGDVLSETHLVNSGNSGLYWIGTVSGAALTFTLASAETLDAVHIWTYSRTGETDRGMQSFDISFSTNGGVSFGTPIGISGVSIGDYPNPITVQTFGFTAQTGVTDIRIDNIINYGDPNYVGLSEIRFESSVPEPSTAILAGLGLAGLCLRRRRRK